MSDPTYWVTVKDIDTGRVLRKSGPVTKLNAERLRRGLCRRYDLEQVVIDYYEERT